MSTDAVTPLRQRMIEDMNARKLGAQLATSLHRNISSNRTMTSARLRPGSKPGVVSKDSIF
jgi:hypothetical protein